VERRQASAPASGGRRKPLFPWREPHPLGAVVGEQRLPAFYFPFLSSVTWVEQSETRETTKQWVARFSR
jgi:hypothetical protein